MPYLLLCLLLLLPIPGQADALPTAEMRTHLSAVEELYPSGKYWNDCRDTPDYAKGRWSSTPCRGSSIAQGTCQSLYYANGWQCWGFANAIAQALFGSAPEKGGEAHGWVKESASLAALRRLEPGDYLRKQTPNGNGHSLIVWKVVNDTVYTAAECHGLEGCRIDWYASCFTFSQLLYDEEHRLQYVWHHPGESTAEDTIRVHPSLLLPTLLQQAINTTPYSVP